MAYSSHMNDQRSDRLRKARELAGYASASDAARVFGWGEAGYRHHENGTRGFSLDAAKKYARAFRVKPGWLLGMEGIDSADLVANNTILALIVGGTVAAGVWREAQEVFDKFVIDAPAPVQDSERFGLVVEGYSMDLFYEPGTILDCISVYANGIEPEAGDHVIVERVKPDGLRERTVKELAVRNGKNYLVPRSSRPEFQSEIELGSPSLAAASWDGEIRVLGFVVSSISPRALRLLDRLGKVRQITS
jgi:SOS-response transcriptional repressor LexA